MKKDDYLSVIPCASLAAQLAVGESDYWQEIEAVTPDELAAWIQDQALHPLVVEDILEPGHSTLIDHYSQAIYIEFPTNPDDCGVGVAYLSIILTSHRITTIRRGDVRAMPGLVERFQHDIRLPIARTVAVLYIILDHFIDQGTLEILKLRDRISLLEKAFINDPEAIQVSVVSQLKQQIYALTNIVEDQRFCVKALKDMKSSTLGVDDFEAYVRDLASNAEHVLRILGRSEERLKDLQSNYQLTVHNASDKRLRVLTIISAIFLPLTLLTGFFGMNFTGMILLDWQYGLWLVLTIMVILLLGMMWYFYRHGWFE